MLNGADTLAALMQRACTAPEGIPYKQETGRAKPAGTSQQLNTPRPRV